MTATSTNTVAYVSSPNQVVTAANGIDYAYRDVGEGSPPVVLLQHFRGNLDNWDPALIDALAGARRVVTFDNVGVGGSTGTTPSTVGHMARGAISFLEAMEFDEVDVLGFSIGSFVAQEIALIRPGAVRRLILAASAPQGAAGMHGWAPEVIGSVGRPAPNPEGYLSVFFAPSPDRAHQLIDRRVLEQKPAGPGPECLDDVIVESERGEDEDLLARHPSRRLDPVHARHADVHQHDVGLVTASELHRLLSVLGHGHHGDRARRLEHGLETRPGERLVVGDENSDGGHQA
jgi:pimeloyl-ACP methyl ester carboxylesterase